MAAQEIRPGYTAGVSFKTIYSFDIHEASPRYSAITGDNGSIIGFKNTYRPHQKESKGVENEFRQRIQKHRILI